MVYRVCLKTARNFSTNKWLMSIIVQILCFTGLDNFLYSVDVHMEYCMCRPDHCVYVIMGISAPINVCDVCESMHALT